MNNSYVLGVDGFPLGTFAAIVVGGKAVDMIVVESASDPIGDLTIRVDEAKASAVEKTGRYPDAIAIASLDDGSNGSGHRELTNMGISVDQTSYIQQCETYLEEVLEYSKGVVETLSAIRAVTVAQALEKALAARQHG